MPIRPIRADETDAVVALWEGAGLTRPWNDPGQDIAFARATPTADVLALVEADEIIGYGDQACRVMGKRLDGRADRTPLG